MNRINLRWTLLIAVILAPAYISDLKNGSGQENETTQTEGKSNKYIDYLQNKLPLNIKIAIIQVQRNWQLQLILTTLNM